MTKVFKKDQYKIGWDDIEYLKLPEELDDFKQVLVQAARSGKYASNNWLTPDGGKQDKKHQYDSIMHHILAHLRGEKLDFDSKLDHRLHAACRLLMDYTRSKRNLKHPNDLTEVEKEINEMFDRRFLDKNKDLLNPSNLSGKEQHNTLYGLTPSTRFNSEIDRYHTQGSTINDTKKEAISYYIGSKQVSKDTYEDEVLHKSRLYTDLHKGMD